MVFNTAISGKKKSRPMGMMQRSGPTFLPAVPLHKQPGNWKSACGPGRAGDSRRSHGCADGWAEASRPARSTRPGPSVGPGRAGPSAAAGGSVTPAKVPPAAVSASQRRRCLCVRVRARASVRPGAGAGAGAVGTIVYQA